MIDDAASDTSEPPAGPERASSEKAGTDAGVDAEAPDPPPTSPVLRVAAFSGLTVVLATVVWRLHRMRLTGHALVGDEARTAVEAYLTLLARPRLGVPTTASQYVGYEIRNPGPLHLWSMLPFVRILGTDLGAWTFAVTTALASLALGGWAARRQRGRAIGLISVVAMVLLMDHADQGAFTHSLNTEVVLLPTFCCFLLAWGVASGDSLLLPILVATATWTVQTTLGQGALLVPVCIVAVGALAWSARGAARPKLRRHALVAAATALVLWLPAIDDQLNGTGNLGKVLRFRPPGRGISAANDALQAILDLPSVLSRTQGPGVLRSSLVGTAVSVLAVVLVAALPATRKTARDLWQLVAVAGAAVAGGAITMASTPASDTATYHYFAVPTARYLVALALVIIVAETARRTLAVRTAAAGQDGAERLARLRTCVLLGLGAMTVIVLVSAITADATPDGRRQEMRAVAELQGQLEGRLDPNVRYRLVSRGGSANGNIAQGLVAALRSKGYDVTASYAPVGDDEVILVVTDDLRAHVGASKATFRPTAPDSRFDPDGLRTWARGAGRLTLTPSGNDNLADRIDGLVPDLCLDDYRDDPAPLLDLDPVALARLYVGGDIASPALTATQQMELDRWAAGREFDVIELPAEGPWRSSFSPTEPFLSNPTC